MYIYIIYTDASILAVETKAVSKPEAPLGQKCKTGRKAPARRATIRFTNG